LHKTYIEKVISFQFLHSKLKIIQKMIVAITIAAILYLAAKEVLANQLTKGDFVLLSAFAFQVFMPISSMGILWKDFQQNLADIAQIQEIYKKIPSTQYASDSSEATTNYYAESYPPSIAFKNVSYKYPNGNLAIDNISFEIPSGSFVGIVGDNGSGKSTLLRLMLGLIQPTSGTIFINGEPAQSDALRKLAKIIGVVPQNINLFHGSISENIFYNSESINTDFQNLLKLVNLDKDISEKFTDGIDTQVGEKGLKLSGGQRQKVAIARALSNNPKLLILDEPSSALDEMSEGITFIEKEQILLNRTVILITHNRNLLKNANLIMEISKGKLVS
jgi:ATP-binding cassette subfamily B protein